MLKKQYCNLFAKIDESSYKLTRAYFMKVESLDHLSTFAYSNPAIRHQYGELPLYISYAKSKGQNKIYELHILVDEQSNLIIAHLLLVRNYMLNNKQQLAYTYVEWIEIDPPYRSTYASGSPVYSNVSEICFAYCGQLFLDFHNATIEEMNMKVALEPKNKNNISLQAYYEHRHGAVEIARKGNDSCILSLNSDKLYSIYEEYFEKE